MLHKDRNGSDVRRRGAEDNPTAWAPNFFGDHRNSRPLLDLLHFYFSFECSTGRVERTLGQVRAAAAHTGADAALIWLSVEMSQDGPQQEDQLFQKVVDQQTQRPVFLVNAFSRLLQKTWLQHHGRRFHLYKTRKDKGVKRGRRKGSENNLVAQQRRARTLICQGVEVLARNSRASAPRLFGKSRTKRLRKSSCWSAQHEKALKLADLRAAQRKALARGGPSGLQAPALRGGKIWSRGQPSSGSHKMPRSGSEVFEGEGDYVV